MSKDRRRLLPYEHDLIDALGVSKEEYFNFLDVAKQYEDEKIGTVYDIRNWPAVAIVLMVVGMIFQVVAALLPEEPQPTAQESGGGQPTNRSDVFAPRASFNSLQQVARYGDPVNLIYANKTVNPNGGVRVATALLWSAMRSYGSSQLVQLQAMIGAGSIGEIDQKLIAFGQTPLRDLVAQNYWVYFNDYHTGKLRNADLLPDPYGLEKETDPTKSGGTSDNPYRISYGDDGKSRKDGFSQSFSLSASKSVGFYSPVAINVDIDIRNSRGDRIQANNGVKLSTNGGKGWSKPLASFKINDEAKITIAKVNESNDEQKEASEYRRAIINVFDNASRFKLGSAIFSVIGLSRGDVEEAEAVVTLRCVEEGKAPSADYDAVEPSEVEGIIFAPTSIEDPDKDIAVLNDVKRIQDDDRTDRTLRQILNSNIQRTESYTAWRSEERIGKGGLYYLQVPYTAYRNVFIRNLTSSEKANLKKYLANQAQYNALQAVGGENYFYIKALVRIESAKYETISPSNIVDIALRSKVFRRINGRQQEYGSERRTGYPVSDNGIKMRSSMFLFKYKKADETQYNYAPGIFVIRRAADQDNYNFLRFDSGATGEANAQHWSFELEPICDFVAEQRKHAATIGAGNYYYIENSGSQQKITLSSSGGGASSFGMKLYFVGTIKKSTDGLPPNSAGPGSSREWDAFSVNADTQYQMSFDNGPEISITAVTEQIVIDTISSSFPNLYEDISLMGLNLYSGKSVSDLRSLSIFVNKGRPVRMLRTKSTASSTWGSAGFEYLPSASETSVTNAVKNTNYIITSVGNTDWKAIGLPKNLTAAVGMDFVATGAGTGTGKVVAAGYANTAPDIFLDTVLDPNDGIGKYASVHCLNIEQLARSKKFCEENQLFMDCVIAEQQAWRSFWSNVAGFSLLELARIGGQDCLIPAIPYNASTGEITQTIKVSALFNTGNIFADSYKEEFMDYGSNTEDIIVTCIYRDLEDTGAFTRNRSVEVRRTYVDENKAIKLDENSTIRQTVDMSAYVSSRDQAILVGKMLCNLRHYLRRAIEFKTFPTEAAIAPGSYVYVELAQNQWNKIYTGVVRSEGVLDAPLVTNENNNGIPDGSYNILIYNPDGGSSGVSKQAIVIQNGLVKKNAKGKNPLDTYSGYLFVMGQEVSSKRVFRVTEVEMDEEGEVTIRGVEHPCDADGKSLIAKGLTAKSTGVFTIDGKDS